MVNLYYTKANGDIVLVKSCNTPVTSTTDGCDVGYNYTCWIGSINLFGDYHRRVYGFIDGTGTLDGFHNVINSAIPTPLAIEKAFYNPLLRPFYLQPNVPGWSNTTYAFASGGQGESYSYPLSNLAIATADRILNEPCSSCILNALAAKQPYVALTEIAASKMQDFGTQRGIPAIETAVNTLFGLVNSAVTTTAQTYGVFFPDVFAGFSNNDVYIINDCRRWTSSCFGSNYTFAVWVRNTATFGDNYLHSFPIVNSSFVNKPLAASSVQYNTTQLPWYSNLRGWSGILLSNPSNEEYRSYSVSMTNISGVVAFSFFTVEAPQCNFSAQVDACHQASYAPNAAIAAGQFATSVPENFPNISSVCTGLFKATVSNLNNNVSNHKLW